MELILVMGSSVKDNKEPGEEFKVRLDKAFEIYSQDKNVILISGRVGNTLNSYPITQAECGKIYLINKGINENSLLLETISCDTAGNFAFSCPIIKNLQPTKLIIVTSEYAEKRVKYLSDKIFGKNIPVNIESVLTNQSNNQLAIEKENKALNMFKALFDKIEDGDYLEIIDTLLIKTPFYNKNMIKDEDFFNKYWNPGGWEDFINNKNLVTKLSLGKQ